jgi:hypothetical protein
MKSIKKFKAKKIEGLKTSLIKGGIISPTGRWGTENSDLYINDHIRTNFDLNPFNND